MPNGNDILPNQGAPDSIVARLMGYVEKFDKEFSEKIRGASKDEIFRLEELSGLRRPIGEISPTYLAFIQGMGVDDGGLLSKNLKIKSDIISLINYYEDCIRLEPETLNVELPVVATYMGGDQVSLNNSKEFPGVEVIETSDGEFQEILSASWENLLMQAAFLKVEPLRLAYGCWASSSENSAKNSIRFNINGTQSASFEVHKFAKEMQLEVTWFSDERRVCAISDDCGFFAKIHKSNRAIINLFSNNDLFLKDSIEYCVDNLGAVAYGSLVNINGELADAGLSREGNRC